MSDNEKINWTPELLAECRNEKGVVLGMMSDEARRALIANKDHAETYFRSREWTDIKNVEIWPIDSWNHAYRLSPSYTPPELQEKPWVDVPVRKSNDDVLLYRTPLGNEKQLVTAMSCISFVGYVYADGLVTVSARRDDFDGGIALAPVSVRFWKGGAK